MSGELQSRPAPAEESSEQPAKSMQNNNPFLNTISHVIELFNSIFSPQKKETNQAVEESAAAADVNEVNTKPEAEAEPAVVRFPLVKHEKFPSVVLEPEEIQERNTNPAVLWQVYAIGGFLILKWGWTRWNERRNRKKPSNDQPPPAP